MTTVSSSAATSQRGQQYHSATSGLQTLLAMARGPFRRDDAVNVAEDNSTTEKDYYSKMMPARNVKVVPTKGPAESRKDRDAKRLDQDTRYNTDEHVEQKQQERFGQKQQQPPTSFVNIRNNTSSFQTVTSEITMLADLLEDEPPPARQEADEEMDQIMKKAMEDMLKFANGSQNNSDQKKLPLAAAKKNSTSYTSFGDISFGVSSIFNHKKRLNKDQNQNNEEFSNYEEPPEIDESHSDSDLNGKSSSEPNTVGLPLHAKNDNVESSHNDVMPSLSTGRSPSTSKAAASNSTAKIQDQDQEEYSDREIDAIIALKLQVANQRTTIDDLSSKLNRALSEKKELEERMERIMQQQQEQQQQQQQQASLAEGSTMVNSGLRQLSMSYKTAASSIFSSFAAHPIDEETPTVAVETQSISQQTSRTANITQHSPQSQTPQQHQQQDPSASQYSIFSSISARWSRENVGSASTQSIRSSSQHEQRFRHPQATTTYDDSSELQSQLQELQSTLAKQIELSKHTEQRWVEQLKQLHFTNQRLLAENIQLKKNQSSCADSSYLSSSGSNRGQNGADDSYRSMPSNYPSVPSALSSQDRTIDSVPLSENKEEENEEDFCLSTECSTKDLCEEKQVDEEVGPIIVETKMI